MALSLLERVKNKALEALTGFGNFVDDKIDIPDIPSLPKLPQPSRQQPNILQGFGDIFKTLNSGIVTNDWKLKNPIESTITPFTSLRNLNLPVPGGNAQAIQEPQMEVPSRFNVQNFQARTPLPITPPRPTELLLNDIRRTLGSAGRDVVDAVMTPPDQVLSEETLKRQEESLPFLVTMATLNKPAGAAVNTVRGTSVGIRGGLKAIAKKVSSLEEFTQTIAKDKKLLQEAQAIFKDPKNSFNTVEDLYTRYAPKRTTQKIIDASKQTRPKVEEILLDGDTGNKFTRFVRDLFLDTPDTLKKTFGQAYETTIQPTITRHTQRLADAVDWKNAYRKKLENLSIKPGSVEDKLIREIGKKGGFEKVSAQVGTQKAQEIQQAYQSLRSMYDEIFDFVNSQRKSAGLPQIPKREDFLSQIGSSGKSIFDATIEGGTQTAEAVSSAIFKRQGGAARTGAIESMRDYLEYAARAGFSDLTAKEFADIRKTISNTASPQVLQQLKKIEDNILGTKVQGNLEKTAMNVLGRMKSAAVVGKVGTLINQGLSLPQGIAASGPINFVVGHASGEARKALAKSNFIKTVGDKIPRSLRTGNVFTKAVGLGGDALVAGQQATNKALWKSFYSKGRRMGLSSDEAIQFADSELPKIVGDRRLGMSPEVYNTLFGKIFGAFTLEPAAASTRLFTQAIKGVKGNPSAIGEVLGTVVAWHIVNKLNEKYGAGYSPFFDPIEASLDSIEYATGTGDKEKDNLKAVGRLFSEMLQTTPAINNVFNSLYAAGEASDILPDSEQVFGQDDNTWMNVGSLYNPLDNATRTITGNKAIDVPINIASNLVPFVDQAAKTTQALFTMQRGHALSKSGNELYEAPSDLKNIARSLIFGQSSTDNARNFFGGTGKNNTGSDSISWKDDNGNTRTVSLTQKDYSNRKGIAGYKQDTSNASKAVQIWAAPNDQVPDEVKIEAYKKLGFEPDDVRYAYKADFTNDEKTAYIRDLNLEHDELIRRLVTGRVESIKGDYFAANGVLDNLYEEGLITSAERSYLKKIKITKDGKLATSSLKALQGTGLSASKIKSMINSLNSLYKDPIKSVTKSTAGLNLKAPDVNITPQRTPDLSILTSGRNPSRRRRSQSQWFDPY